uniref:Uncharacterized protein n=1 Tax=Magnetococcus massalia (strain MO-1) TaxID=451514 RepID=A0A1S7LL21_MAGMO|nr:protein of unknown function [Candidatus Magnetococcus massalia]
MTTHNGYSYDLGERIANAMAKGKSLTLAAESQGIPGRTAYRWQHKYSDFAEMLRIARQARADRMVDEAFELAAAGGDPQLLKVRIDLLKWTASRMDRDQWGEKVQVGSVEPVSIRAAMAAAEKRLEQLRGCAHDETALSNA